MKLNLLFVGMLLFSFSLSAQDTTVIWINNVDSLTYKISYNKNEIPKQFYKAIGIERKNEIANPTDKWTPSCVSEPHHKLNWIAKDKNNHWVISVTYGGRGVWTNYYFFDKEKGKLNVNELKIRDRRDRRDGTLTFGEVVQRINSKKYERAEVDLTQ